MYVYFSSFLSLLFPTYSFTDYPPFPPFAGNNTGFKNYDPTHPCRKCWERHATPYAGALAYTPWSNNNPTTRRRRALIRIFRSRCLISPAGAGAGVGGGRLRRSWSRERIGRGGGVGYSSRRRITALYRVQTSLIPIHFPSTSTTTSTSIHRPPTTYPPLNSLLRASPQVARSSNMGTQGSGGKLCYKCPGSGVVPFFIFEEVTCGVCGGVGRLFRGFGLGEVRWREGRGVGIAV
jgi:hypothetical protein